MLKLKWLNFNASIVNIFPSKQRVDIAVRTKQHFRNLGLNHTEKSATASNFWNMGHEINNSANLIKSVNKKNELITWEKIFINKHAHHMNFEVLSLKSMYADHHSSSMAPISITIMRDETLLSI